MNILVIWKALVEFDQISFFEFVLEDDTLLQIDNFHNYVSQKASFQWQSQTDFLKVLFSKNMHPDKIKFSETDFVSNLKCLEQTSMKMGLHLFGHVSHSVKSEWSSQFLTKRFNLVVQIASPYIQILK